MKTFTFLIGALAAACAARGAAPEAAAQDQTSVLVRLQTVSRQAQVQTLDTFGEIATAKPESLSVPQAGQLLVLPVLLGQRLRRGDPVAVIGTDPNARAAYAQAADALGFARRELQRQQQLLGLQLATQSQLDAARRQLEDSQAALAAQARLGGARASVTLRAPFDAVVTALPLAQGERIGAGTVVAQLGRADRPRALLAIEPGRSSQLKAGMAVTLTPLLDGAAPIAARLSEVGALVDPKTQMVTAVAELVAGGATGLAAGTRVEAAIRLGAPEAWRVPRQAVLSDAGGSYLFQVARLRARRVALRVLGESGASYAVDGKLDPALPVVVLGNYELQDGMAVREGAQ